MSTRFTCHVRRNKPALSVPTSFARIAVGLVMIAVPAKAGAQSAAELSPAVREYVSVAEPVVALRNVRVIDGTGSAPREGQTIVIQNGNITAVGATQSVTVPAGARVLDLPGATVIPGIIGLHDHTFYNTAVRSVQQSYSAPRLYLASGVTT